jgi:hypothetical protein
MNVKNDLLKRLFCKSTIAYKKLFYEKSHVSYNASFEEYTRNE